MYVYVVEDSVPIQRDPVAATADASGGEEASEEREQSGLEMLESMGFEQDAAAAALLQVHVVYVCLCVCGFVWSRAGMCVSQTQRVSVCLRVSMYLTVFMPVPVPVPVLMSVSVSVSVSVCLCP